MCRSGDEAGTGANFWPGYFCQKIVRTDAADAAIISLGRMQE